ncbi:MAG: hypothetical protein WDM80_08655 [Limisphaerales bacterium]
MLVFLPGFWIAFAASNPVNHGADGGEVGGGDAAGGKVGSVGGPECFDALKSVVSACFPVVHIESFWFVVDG